MAIKQRNRAVFDEKLLHRYLWEMFYQHPSEFARLLPPTWRDRAGDLNLVVPEKVTDRNYNADLALYFRGRRQEVLVEVKWKTAAFTGANQLAGLRRTNGFGITFEPNPPAFIEGEDIPIVGIDRSEFLTWLARNISRLAEETLDSKNKGDVAQVARTDWLLVLKRGDMLRNFEKMMDYVSRHRGSNAFWAFRTKPATMRQLLHVRGGDRVLIIQGTVAGTRGHEIGRTRQDRQRALSVKRWYLATVRTPYFMVVDPREPLGTLYETGRPAVGDRLFPHFIDFDGRLIDEGESRVAPIGKLIEPLADSWSRHTGPLVPLPPSVAQELIDALRHGRSASR